MHPSDIPDNALDFAAKHDYINRGRPDGGHWTRVYNDQIRRLLTGLTELGYMISPPPLLRADIEGGPVLEIDEVSV